MKKPIFYFVVSVITIGFALGISPAHAASLVVQPPETEAQSMVMLRQSLDVLADVLRHIDTDAKAGQPQDATQISVALVAIQAQLIGIQASLAASGSSLASQSPAVMPSTSAIPAPQKPLVSQFPNITQETMLALPNFPNTEKAYTTPPPPNSNNARLNEAAAIGSSSPLKNLAWPIIAVLVAFGIILFLFKAREKKTSMSAG